VLVHCAAGVSRSGAIVTAYVMHHKKIPFEQALAFVKSSRPIVEPNSAFKSQLKKYQEELNLN